MHCRTTVVKLFKMLFELRICWHKWKQNIKVYGKLETNIICFEIFKNFLHAAILVYVTYHHPVATITCTIPLINLWKEEVCLSRIIINYCNHMISYNLKWQLQLAGKVVDLIPMFHTSWYSVFVSNLFYTTFHQFNGILFQQWNIPVHAQRL